MYGRTQSKYTRALNGLLFKFQIRICIYRPQSSSQNIAICPTHSTAHFQLIHLYTELPFTCPLSIVQSSLITNNFVHKMMKLNWNVATFRSEKIEIQITIIGLELDACG